MSTSATRAGSTSSSTTSRSAIRAIERERPLAKALLEQGERGFRPRARQRAGLRHRGVPARGAEGRNELGRHTRTVDGQEHRDVVRSGPQACDHTGDRRPHVRSIVEHVERQLTRLADHQHLVTCAREHATPPVVERLAFQFDQRLRRAEAPARTADEQDAGQRSTRHGSV